MVFSLLLKKNVTFRRTTLLLHILVSTTETLKERGSLTFADWSSKDPITSPLNIGQRTLKINKTQEIKKK